MCSEINAKKGGIVKRMLFWAAILGMTSAGYSEVIVEGYTADDDQKPETLLETMAREDAAGYAVAHIEGVDFTLRLSNGGIQLETATRGTLEGVTIVEKGSLGNGLYRVRMRIPDSVTLRDQDLRDSLEPTAGSGTRESSRLDLARRRAISAALTEAISRVAEDWYGGTVPEEVTGRYYDLEIVEEEILSDTAPYSCRVDIEVKIWFADPRATAVESTTWGRVKRLFDP